MESILTNLAYDVLVILVPILVGLTVAWLKQKFGLEKLRRVQTELQTKQELALLAVRFAEQAYRDYDGKKKYEQALVYLSRELAQLGIKVSEETLEGLIESALRILKDEFGEQWAGAI